MYPTGDCRRTVRANPESGVRECDNSGTGDMCMTLREHPPRSMNTINVESLSMSKKPL